MSFVMVKYNARPRRVVFEGVVIFKGRVRSNRKRRRRVKR